MMELCRFQFHLLRVFAACVLFVHFNSLVAKASIISNETQARKEDTGPMNHWFNWFLPDLCKDASIDAATTTQDGRTYVFKGDYYWEVNNDGLVYRWPRPISEDWGGLPGNLDAALTWANGDTYFFKKNEYWKTRNKQMQWGYPLSIQQFWGLPDDLDAAFVWGENGKSYFFKGSQFWGYDQNTKQPIASFYPRPISEWKDIPDNIDAVLPWAFDKTYFFKGPFNYRYNNKKLEVDKDDPPPFPRPTAFWWFGCK